MHQEVSHDQPTTEELEELNQLIGLSREEVIKKIGSPDEQIFLDDRYYLIYTSMVDEYSRRTYIGLFIVGPYWVPMPIPEKKKLSGQETQCLMIEIGSDNLVEEYIFEYIDTADLGVRCLDIYFSDSELKRATFVINQVTIDIRPHTYSNHVDPASKEDISVAVLSTTNFDARDVNPSTVVFGPEQAAISSSQAWRDVDVNGDGERDRIFFFRISETGIACGDKRAALTGETFEGYPISGSDWVMTANCD